MCDHCQPWAPIIRLAALQVSASLAKLVLVNVMRLATFAPSLLRWHRCAELQISKLSQLATVKQRHECAMPNIQNARLSHVQGLQLHSSASQGHADVLRVDVEHGTAYFASCCPLLRGYPGCYQLPYFNRKRWDLHSDQECPAQLTQIRTCYWLRIAALCICHMRLYNIYDTYSALHMEFKTVTATGVKALV